MKQVYPRVEKVSASSFSSRGLFFSSIWTVRPRYAWSDNCSLSEKKSPLLEKEDGPWPFPLQDILVSGPTEHLFWMAPNPLEAIEKTGVQLYN